MELSPNPVSSDAVSRKTVRIELNLTPVVHWRLGWCVGFPKYFWSQNCCVDQKCCVEWRQEQENTLVFFVVCFPVSLTPMTMA